MAAVATKSDERRRQKLERRQASRIRHEKRQELRGERDRRLSELAAAYRIGVRNVWTWWWTQ